VSEKSSDAPKPGSKLAQVQALGRRGGIRPAAGETVRSEAREASREDAAQARPAPAPAQRSERTRNSPRKASVTLSAKLETAKATLAKAEEDAMVKPGPQAVVGEPWKDQDPPISKTTYYRRLEKEAKAKATKAKKAKAPVKQGTQKSARAPG
jgi:hypothetical protein